MTRPSPRAATRRPWVVAGVAAALVGSVLVGLSLGVATRPVPGHGSGPGFVVGLGDSYLSGVGGRWAGNTHAWNASDTDALGSKAYSGGGCERAASSEVLIDPNAVDLACAGARSGDLGFRGGDTDADGSASGQAAALRSFARTHRVRTVVVSIGGNDIGFGSLVRDCVQDFVLSASFAQNHCSGDDDVTARFTASALDARAGDIATALRSVSDAMKDAGYRSRDWTLVVQDYPSPLPPAAKTRYGEKYHQRSTTGGCGLWNADLDWADNHAVPAIDDTVWRGVDKASLPNVVRLDVRHLFDGHRLCEKGVGKLFETHTASWRSPGAVDDAEWVTDVRTATLAHTPFTAEESLHPNYWGQLALRSCLRQVVATGMGGSCRPSGTGLDRYGEPPTRVR